MTYASLWDVVPSLSQNDSGNLCLADIVDCGQLSVGSYFRIAVPDFSHFFFRQPTSAIVPSTFVAPVTESAFGNSVVHVFKRCPGTQMGRIAAGRIVIGMKDVKPFRNGSVRQKISEAMGWPILIVKRECSIRANGRGLESFRSMRQRPTAIGAARFIKRFPKNLNSPLTNGFFKQYLCGSHSGLLRAVLIRGGQALIMLARLVTIKTPREQCNGVYA